MGRQPLQIVEVEAAEGPEVHTCPVANQSAGESGPHHNGSVGGVGHSAEGVVVVRQGPRARTAHFSVQAVGAG